jgi:hypothetical protein
VTAVSDQNSSMIQRTGRESRVNMGEPGRKQGVWSLRSLVSTFVAGVDVTARNGGTHVIPGISLPCAHGQADILQDPIYGLKTERRG